MVDMDTFLTTLYVIVDEYCKLELPAEVIPHGPDVFAHEIEALPHIKCVCLLIFRSGQHRQENILTDEREAISRD